MHSFRKKFGFYKYYVSPEISDSVLNYFHSDGKLSKLCFDNIPDFVLIYFLYAKQKWNIFVAERNCCYFHEARKCI